MLSSVSPVEVDAMPKIKQSVCQGAELAKSLLNNYVEY
jgi:hypothetical protein